VTFESGTPGGRLTVDFKAGGRGDKVATGVTRLKGSECRNYWKLRAVKGNRVTLDSFDTSSSPLCAGDVKGDVFTLDGGKLRFRSGAGPADGGKGPSGTLRKIG
jgi:hypothetical protein